MANIICVNCMKGTLDANGVCSACKKADADLETSRRHLTPRTILKGKYLVGKVIGEGGFGITYIGYDLDLEIRVAIKEFCPRDFAARDITDGLTILPFDRESAEFFQAEKEKFINEAKRLGKFRGEQGIVSVQDYFQENGTAYIVMEYIDGITLKNFQSMIGTSMEVEKVLNLMKPVMEGLAKLHENGVIHRDISPDNIMIDTAKEKIYLIDFGTAREVRFQEERSLSVYKKGGYTPIEQQTSHGKQGPWTDVYALCATIYRCITGKSIPEVNNRLVGDALIKPSDMGVAINAQTEAALLHGLAIKPEERTQNMKQLMKELYEIDPKPQKTESKVPITVERTVMQHEIKQKSVPNKTDKIKKKMKILAIVFCVCVVLFGVKCVVDSRIYPGRVVTEYDVVDDYTKEWEYSSYATGWTKRIEYETKDTYTVNWENAKGELHRTAEYIDGRLRSAVGNRCDERTNSTDWYEEYYEYETKNNYTITRKNDQGEIEDITSYENNRPVKIEHLDDKYTAFYEYETKDDYTISYEFYAGDTGVEVFLNDQMIEQTLNYADGSFKRVYNFENVGSEEKYSGDGVEYKYDREGQLIETLTFENWSYVEEGN